MEKKRNLWVIPTDKPSRLVKHNVKHTYELLSGFIKSNPSYTTQHIYITSDEEIKLNDHVIQVNFEKTNIQVIQCVTEFQVKIANDKYGSFTKKKIILTTDQELIEDGVQAITNTFAEWFCSKNPSCEEVEVIDNLKYFNVDELRERHIKKLPHLYSEKIGYKIIIPKEESKALTKLEIAKNIAAIGIGKKEEPKTSISLTQRVSLGLDRELKRQKKAGKQFLSDDEIDNLVDNIIKDEMGDSWKESYKEPKQEYICYKCQNKTNNKFEICDKCNVGWKESKQEARKNRLLEELVEDIKNQQSFLKSVKKNPQLYYYKLGNCIYERLYNSNNCFEMQDPYGGQSSKMEQELIILKAEKIYYE